MKIETVLLPCEIRVIDRVERICEINIPALNYCIEQLTPEDQVNTWLAVKGNNRTAMLQIDYRYAGWPRIARIDDVLQIWELTLIVDGRKTPLDPDDYDVFSIEAALEEHLYGEVA